jgi:mannose PTS system EIID component
MKPIPRGMRTNMVLRSLTVQGSWNYATLIGAGFAFTLLPVLRSVYRGRPEELRIALARHSELFNSHPYLATLAAGAVGKLEAEGVEPAVIERFKTALRGSLGSIGDRLVWTVWRPMSVLAGLVLLLAGAPWWLAIGAFLVVYNALHLPLRVMGLRVGASAGLGVARILRDAPLQPVITRASQVAAFLIGLGVVLRVWPVLGDPLAAAVAAGAIALGAWRGQGTRRLMWFVLSTVAVIAIGLGILGYGA